MKKISTLYKKNPENLGRVFNEISPENQWVFDGDGLATRKFDGTASTIIDGEIYKRYDVKKGKSVPENAIPCQEPDEITGHWPHWVKCDRSKPEDKYFFEAFDLLIFSDAKISPKELDGTYELCGPKIKNDPEKFCLHRLVKHGSIKFENILLTFEGIRQALELLDIEGIVFHHKTDERMCKIRKSDFGIKR